MPSLRSHSDDIPLLATEFLTRLTPEGQLAPAVSLSAMQRLVAYDWPGNVRELENVIRRLHIQGLATIQEVHLPGEFLAQRSQGDRTGSLRCLEDQAIRGAVEATRGKRAEAARRLGIDRKTLYRKLKRLGPEP